MSDQPAPVLRRTPTGWLAVSPPGASLRFAVAGATEGEVKGRYVTSYAKWRESAQRAELGATCRCGHHTDDHDAGECWAEVDGGQCGCGWYELVAGGVGE